MSTSKKATLRRFVVRSNGKPKIGSDVVITAEAPEHFPYVMKSDEGEEMLVKIPSQELRARFAYWINDAGKGRNSILCVVGPVEGKSKKFLQPVPLGFLRAFFDDIAFDWAKFPEDHVPPVDDTGRPLFDPRFVSAAAERPTTADKEAAAAAAAAAAVAAQADVPMSDAAVSVEDPAKPGFLTKEKASGKKGPPPAAPPRSSDKKGKDKDKDKTGAKSTPKPKSATKPKAKATATAKAKDTGAAKLKPKPKRASKAKAKAAASNLKWVDIPVHVSEVHPEEASDTTLVNSLTKCQLWFGNDMDDHPNLMEVIEEMTGMVPGIDACALMCEQPY